MSGRVGPLDDAEDDEVAMYCPDSVLNQILKRFRLETKARSKAVVNEQSKGLTEGSALRSLQLESGPIILGKQPLL